MSFDCTLIGLWKPKGATAPHRQFRVDATGRYLLAYPAQPYAFKTGGMAMVWGAADYSKQLGPANQLPGIWVADADGEEYNFRADGTYTVHVSETEEYFGLYESQDSDTKLWIEEFRSLLSTNGGSIIFDPPYAPDTPYRYILSEPYWTLEDAATGAPIFEYERIVT